MKLILITLVALVVGMMGACSSAPTATPTPTGPTITKESAVALVKQYLKINKITYGKAPFLQLCSDISSLQPLEEKAHFDPETSIWTVGANQTESSPNPLLRSLQETALWEVHEELLDSPMGGVVSIGETC